MRSSNVVRQACTFLLFLRLLRTLWAVLCAHLLFLTLAHTWVCLLCVCGSGIFSPLDPLPSSGNRSIQRKSKSLGADQDGWSKVM